MNRTEIKSLLKMRDMLLNSHEKSNINAGDTNNSFITNIIYKNIRNSNSSNILDIDKRLLKYVKESPTGRWLLEIKGMTPDLAAGIIAYFDVKNKDCAAQFIKYSGADNYNNPHNSNVREIMKKIVGNFKSEPESLYGRLNDDKFIELIIQDGMTIESAEIKAERYMRKVFIAHVFEQMYREEHNGKLPNRYNDKDCVIIKPEVPYTI